MKTALDRFDVDGPKRLKYANLEGYFLTAGGTMYEIAKETREIEVAVAARCDGCGKRIPFDSGTPHDDFFAAHKVWGSQSEYAEEEHRFILCEDCYKDIIMSGQIKVQRQKVKTFEIR